MRFWWAPVHSIVGVIAGPPAQAGFVDMTHRKGDVSFRAVATPVDFDGHRMRAGPVPQVREHTDDILHERGSILDLP